MKIIFRIILSALALSLLLGYLSIYINPTRIWFFSFFGLYFIPLVIINLIFLIIAIVLRSKAAWITVVAILPALLFLDTFVSFGKEIQKKPSAHPVKMMTYNVGRFISSRGGDPSQHCRSSVLDYVASQDPEVITFQEFSVPDTNDIKTILPQYPYRQYHFFRLKNEFFGNITFSKYPMAGGGKISFKHSTNLSIYSDIDMDGTIVRVYNNHLQSYNISLTSFIKKLRDNIYDSSDEIIHLHEKMRISNSIRAEQVGKVLNHIRQSPYGTFICGDFNDTPMSYTYHKLSRGRKDTFVEAGKGFGASYSFFWPMLRIDYILVPESFDVSEHTTLKVKYSDHYPVLTTIF